MNKDLYNLIIVQTAIEDCIEFITSVNEDDFLNDKKTKQAVLMQLIHIGEHGGKISEKLKAQFKEIEWQTLKAARNYYIHQYGSIDWLLVWEVASRDVIILKTKVNRVVELLIKEQNNATDQ